MQLRHTLKLIRGRQSWRLKCRILHNMVGGAAAKVLQRLDQGVPTRSSVTTDAASVMLVHPVQASYVPSL